MKKLLCLLTVATIVSATSSPITLFLNANVKSIVKNLEKRVYAPTNFKNIIRNFNRLIDMESLEKEQEVNDIINDYVNKFYQRFFNDQQGSLSEIKMTPKDEVTLQTFSNTYTNNTDREQTYHTQEYSKTITNSHSFSVSVSEKVSFHATFKIPFINKSSVNAEIRSEQRWTYFDTTSEILTNPSQPFTVGAHSVGKATYIIKQGTYYNEGVVRFPVGLSWTDDNDKFAFPMFLRNGSGGFAGYINAEWSFRDFISELNNLGYGEEIKKDSLPYSIFTIDNLENPTEAYLNLPITWESQGGKLGVTFTEEPLTNF